MRISIFCLTPSLIKFLTCYDNSYFIIQSKITKLIDNTKNIAIATNENMKVKPKDACIHINFITSSILCITIYIFKTSSLYYTNLTTSKNIVLTRKEV